MKYRIHAVDSSGAERTATVTADSEKDAVAKAKSNGLFPTKVDLIGGDPEPIRTTPPVFVAAEKPDVRGTYKYKMIQVPPNIIAQPQRESVEAAHYLQTIVNNQADEGWEFYRIDAIGVRIPQGCIAGLFGNGEETRIYNVITFRRWIE